MSAEQADSAPSEQADSAPGEQADSAPGEPSDSALGGQANPSPDEPVKHGLPELIAERRAHAERLRGEGVEVNPVRYPGVEPIAQVRAAYEHLAVGEETEDKHRVAGRIAARRGSGKAAFLDLVDRTGRIQLHARLDVLGEETFARLTSLDLGDLLGVDGAAMRSRRGEISLRVDDFTTLGKALRPPPDKHHGLTDVETRHRQRELDLIASESARQRFVDRARIITAIRSYLDGEGFIEVETPVLQPLYGGALARPFTTHHNALDRPFYLRIATELYLKRLIVGGLERVYELGKDFRNEGVSTRHNPEFTMVEWYEAYADYLDEAARLEALVAAAAAAIGYAGELDLAAPWRRVTFHEAIAQATGIDLAAHPAGGAEDGDGAPALARAIAARAPDLDIGPAEAVAQMTWPQLADGLLSKYVEPTLQQPTFVLDYPVALSPFARPHRTQAGLTERWEAYAGGMEIANAFSELTDPDEQRARFESQRRLALAGEQETQPHDELFLEALEHGLPPTGGVGLGVDRLVMLLTGQTSIREVVLFPALRS